MGFCPYQLVSRISTINSMDRVFSCENPQQISEDRRRCQERGWIDEQTLSLQAKVHLISRWNLFVLYFGASALQKKAQTPIKTGVIWVPGRWWLCKYSLFSPLFGELNDPF